MRFSGQTFFGIVEDSNDRLNLGRVRVRIPALHTHDKSILKTEDLPWAMTIQSFSMGSCNVPIPGSAVIVQFMDYPHCQVPIVLGRINTIPQKDDAIIEAEPISIPSVKTTENPTGSEIKPNTVSENSTYSTTNGTSSTADSTSNKQKIIETVLSSSSTQLGLSPNEYCSYYDVGHSTTTNYEAYMAVQAASGSINDTVNLFLGKTTGKLLNSKYIPSSLSSLINTRLNNGLSQSITNFLTTNNGAFTFISKMTNAAIENSLGISLEGISNTINQGLIVLDTAMSVYNQALWLKANASSYVKSQINAIKSYTVETFTNTISEIRSSAINTIWDSTGGGLLSTMQNSFSIDWSYLNTTFDRTLSLTGGSLSTTMSASLSAFSDEFSKAWSNMTSAASEFISQISLAGIIETIKTQITNILTEAVTKVTNFVAGICEYVISQIVFGLNKIIKIIQLIKNILTGESINQTTQMKNAMIAQTAISKIGCGYYANNFINSKYNGNMLAYVKTGKALIDASAFQSVGAGTTVPVFGNWGGPNVGCKMIEESETKVESMDLISYPFGVTRDIIKTLPSSIYGFGQKVTNIIQGITDLTPQMIKSTWSACELSFATNMIKTLNKLGIESASQQINFISVMAYLSSGFSEEPYTETLNYTSVKNLLADFEKELSTSEYSTEEKMKELLWNPRKLAEVVYDGRGGNISTGDGYRYRGRGYIVIRYRMNYELISTSYNKLNLSTSYNIFLNKPELLEEKETAVLCGFISLYNKNGASANLKTLCQYAGISESSISSVETHQNKLKSFYDATVAENKKAMEENNE